VRICRTYAFKQRLPILTNLINAHCFGEVAGGMVRFTYRATMIRMIGAGYWRKGKAIYERENG
jgi:hypothetical protein